MVFQGLKIRTSYWLVIMAITVIFLISITCSTWIMHKAYKNGLINNPDLNGVYIEMGDNWYPEMTSESGLGKVLSWLSSGKYPRSKGYPMAIYSMADNCSNSRRLIATRLPKEMLATSRFNKKIVSEKHYNWGLAEIVKDGDGKQAENVLNKAKKTVLVREYGLFITVDDLSSLDDIISIKDEAVN